MLTKQEYLNQNRRDFQSLTPAEKKIHYDRYVARYTARMKNKNNKNRNMKNFNKNKINYNRSLVVAETNKPLKAKISQLKLSECLLNYAKASIDPFTSIQTLPCIPDTVCAPSYKFKTFIDTTMVIGVNGVGYAAFNPWTMAANDNTIISGASDYSLMTTNATYAPTNYENDLAAYSGSALVPYNSNSQYSTAEILSGSLRLVAAGMEVQYTGVLLNQAGAISAIQWDGQRAVPSGVPIGFIRSNQRTQTCPTSKDSSCYVRYEPTTTSNFDYAPFNDKRPTVNTNLEPFYYPLLIIISGGTAGTSFRVKAVAYFEMQTNIAPVTPSESDPIGFPAFQSARSSVLPTDSPRNDLISILKKTGKNILTTISGLAPAAGTAIGTVFGNPAAGAIAGNFTKDVINQLFQ